MKTNHYLTAKDYIIAIVISVIVFCLLCASIPLVGPIAAQYINITDFCVATTIIITIINFIVILFICKINNYIRYKENTDKSNNLQVIR